jgi:hypothetical protein
MFGFGDRPRADDHFRLCIDDRFHDRRDVARVVLVVGVGVDDDVRAARDARFQAGHERCSETAVHGMSHDVVDAERARDIRRRIGRTIVDDEPFDAAASFDRARQIGMACGNDSASL